jgi:hypothetical protein
VRGTNASGRATLCNKPVNRPEQMVGGYMLLERNLIEQYRARGFGAYETRGLNILQKSTLILGTR